MVYSIFAERDERKLSSVVQFPSNLYIHLFEGKKQGLVSFLIFKHWCVLCMFGYRQDIRSNFEIDIEVYSQVRKVMFMLLIRA